MGDDEIKSFKIGDSHRQGLSAPAQKADETASASEASQSLGFTRIETLLDNDDPESVGASLNSVLQALSELEQNAPSNRDKLQAQKAIVAVEKAVDLMDYLYQTKQSMGADPS